MFGKFSCTVLGRILVKLTGNFFSRTSSFYVEKSLVKTTPALLCIACCFQAICFAHFCARSQYSVHVKMVSFLYFYEYFTPSIFLQEAKKTHRRPIINLNIQIRFFHNITSKNYVFNKTKHNFGVAVVVVVDVVG